MTINEAKLNEFLGKAVGDLGAAISATLVSIGGQVLPATALEQVASLPTREQALSMLLGALKAPMQKLASLLNEPPAKLARTLAAYRDQKGGAAASA